MFAALRRHNANGDFFWNACRTYTAFSNRIVYTARYAWSSHAKASNWVMKEVGYAIQRKGGDDDSPPDIHPIIIEGPPPVPPPPELAHLHFNDRLIYFMDRDPPPV